MTKVDGKEKNNIEEKFGTTKRIAIMCGNFVGVIFVFLIKFSLTLSVTIFKMMSNIGQEKKTYKKRKGKKKK